jgi:hypothetical protein
LGIGVGLDVMRECGLREGEWDGMGRVGLGVSLFDVCQKL